MQCKQSDFLTLPSPPLCVKRRIGEGGEVFIKNIPDAVLRCVPRKKYTRLLHYRINYCSLLTIPYPNGYNGLSCRSSIERSHVNGSFPVNSISPNSTSATP